jgi:hypothetical protein
VCVRARKGKKRGRKNDVRFALKLDGPVPWILTFEHTLELESESLCFPVSKL